jgi:hypothetical protein
VLTPFSVQIDGVTVTVPVLLRQFGARNGMLLVTEYGQIRPHADRVVELGYGYSCLSEPVDPEHDDDAAWIDTVRDWGWSGDGAPPAWLAESAE